MRKHLLLLAVLAVAVAALPQKVETLDDGPAEALGESAGTMTFMRAKAGVKKLWTKTDTKPQGTVVRKTIPDVEKHGKCRFACYQDKLCGGYSFVQSIHSCELLSAPNFFATKSGNDKWHETVSGMTGASYKADEVKKESAAIKKGLKNIPKVKSKSVPNNLEGAPLNVGLENVMNEELEKASLNEEVVTGTSDAVDKKLEAGNDVDEDLQTELRKYRTFLYTEFYEKYAHEFEHRAESMAERRARFLVDKRVKKMNIDYPDNTVSNREKVKLYNQARKQVNNHSIRHFQRSFAKRLKAWAANKMFTKQAQLLAQSQARARAKAEETLKEEEEANAAEVEGKEKPEAAATTETDATATPAQ